MTSDLTILIQGPLNRVSLDQNQIRAYQGNGHIIVSHWDDDPKSEIPDGVEIITSHFPGTKGYVQPTADRQFWGIFYGLEKVQTEFVVRTRSDEFWNLEPLIEEYFAGDTGRVLCGNIFFKKGFPYHLGDHVFIGQTALLRAAYHFLCHDHRYGGDYAEAALAKALMDAKGMPHNKDSFKTLFDLIDINRLKPFRAAYRSAEIVYDNHFEDPNVFTNRDQL